MDTPLITPVGQRAFDSLIALFATIILSSGTTALAEDADDGFLKRKLKYLPAVEVLPIAEKALAAASGADAPSTNGTGGAYESAIVGDTLLVADAHRNRLLVFGSAEHRELVRDLLDEIDVRPAQVLISAAILQVNIDGEAKRAAEILPLVKGVTVGDEKIDLSDALRESAKGGATIVEICDFTGEHFRAYSEALEKAAEPRARVLTRPMVFTAHNQSATLSIGLGEFFLDADTTFSLDVLPLSNNDEELDLSIDSRAETVLADGSIRTQAFATRMSLQNQSVVAFAGIYFEKGGNRSELLVLLHPQIIPGEGN